MKRGRPQGSGTVLKPDQYYMSEQEVADALGVSVATVKFAQYKALKKLRASPDVRLLAEWLED